MAGIANKAEDDMELCTVKAILGKRLNPQRQPEYLVSWTEYPNEDTWETI